MVVRLIPIAAQIARVVADKGIKAAIKKFGKETVKKNAKNVPQLVRAKKIKDSTKAGESYRKTKSPKSKVGKDFKPVSPSRSQAGIRASQSEKRAIARGEKPDRRSTLGKRGYNFKNGGPVAGRLAKRGYGISR
jgi:hypothetical protein